MPPVQLLWVLTVIDALSPFPTLSVEQSDASDYVGQFLQLFIFVLFAEGHERPQLSLREYTL